MFLKSSIKFTLPPTTIKYKPIKRSDHLCNCGCGSFTNIIARTDTAQGHTKGAAYGFLSGHNNKHPYTTISYKRKGIDGMSRLFHRMVMEKHLGRKLLSTEIVHHIDGNIHNNEISNLTIMTLSEHTTLHKNGIK